MSAVLTITSAVFNKYSTLGAIQVLRNAYGGGEDVKCSGKKRYGGVSFNVIIVTRGWVGVQFPGKKRYVTLEWPLIMYTALTINTGSQISGSLH